MARRKAAQRCEIRPCLSAKSDCREGRFIQVGNSLLLSPAFHGLSSGAKHLYLCCSMESGGRNRFTFTRGAAKKYGIATTSFVRYAQQLQDAGFIRRVESDYQFEAARFEFSSAWKGTESATHFGGGKG